MGDGRVTSAAPPESEGLGVRSGLPRVVAEALYLWKPVSVSAGGDETRLAVVKMKGDGAGGGCCHLLLPPIKWLLGMAYGSCLQSAL